MHKRKVLCFREPEVHTILLRRLGQKGYRVYPKVQLADAIGKDPYEHLPTREFDYLTRAHLDFLVVKDETPVFSVEFDGLDHLEDPKVMERDAIKNRLCKLADLPMLRITSAEITEWDEFTILDYMLMLYVAWDEEKEEIFRQIEVYRINIDPHVDPEKLAVDLDPVFLFSLRHPFPGLAIIRERLWRRHKIAWNLDRDSRRHLAIYLCDVTGNRGGSLRHDQFHTVETHAVVWRAGSGRDNPLFSKDVSVTLRAWLPLRPDVPAATDIDLFGGTDVQELDAALARLKARVEGMWFPSLPGLNPFDVTENYSEYLAFRAIERWAKDVLRD